MKMRREQEYLASLVRDKSAAITEYDRMIKEADTTL